MKLSALLVAAAAVFATTNAQDAPERNLMMRPDAKSLPNTFLPMSHDERRLEGPARRTPDSVLKAQEKMHGMFEPTTFVPQVEKRRLTAREPHSVMKAQEKMRGVLEPTTFVPQVEKRSLRTDSE